MGSVIGEILPLAVGIAISPIPIIAVILMLLSPHATGTSVGFMIGWIAGVVVAIVLFTLLSSVIPKGTGCPSPIGAVIKIIVGALLLFLALKQWRASGKGRTTHYAEMDVGDRHDDRRQSHRSWALVVSSESKELLLAVSAGLIVGGAGLTFSQTSVVIIIFVLLAACTVIIPVIGYLIASARLAGPLDKLREWLVENNATIMAVLLLVIGVAVIGKGIGSF